MRTKNPYWILLHLLSFWMIFGHSLNPAFSQVGEEFRFQTYYDGNGVPRSKLFRELPDGSWVLLQGKSWEELLQDQVATGNLASFLKYPGAESLLERRQAIAEAGLTRQEWELDLAVNSQEKKKEKGPFRFAGSEQGKEVLQYFDRSAGKWREMTLGEFYQRYDQFGFDEEELADFKTLIGFHFDLDRFFFEGPFPCVLEQKGAKLVGRNLLEKLVEATHKVLTKIVDPSTCIRQSCLQLQSYRWDDYEFSPSFLERLQAQGLTPLEAYVLAQYKTLAGYGEFNRYMRGEASVSPFSEALNHTFVLAMNKLPAYHDDGGRVVRGVSLSKFQWREVQKLGVGDRVFDRAIMSTSWAESPDSYFLGGDYPFTIEIKRSTSGKVTNEDENEVTFAPMTTFKVLEVKEDRLILEEVERDLSLPHKDMLKNDIGK